MSIPNFKFELHKSVSYENFKTEIESTFDRINLLFTKSTSTSSLVHLVPNFNFVLHKSASYENFKTEIEKTFDRISLHLSKSVSTSNLSKIEQLEEVFLKNLTMTNLQEARQALPTCTDEQNYERFIEVADRLTDKFTTLAAQSDFITIVLTKLDGKAQQIARCCPVKTWPAIKKALRNQFKSNLDVDVIYRQLTNCKQGKEELIVDYSLRLRMLLQDLEEAFQREQENHVTAENTKLRFFVGGIRDPQLRTLVKARGFDQMETAVEFATSEEAQVLAQTVPTPQIICDHCFLPGHKVFDCLKFKTENNICLKCRMVGHWPKDCPQRNQINTNFSSTNNLGNSNRTQNYRQNYQHNYRPNYSNNQRYGNQGFQRPRFENQRFQPQTFNRGMDQNYNRQEHNENNRNQFPNRNDNNRTFLNTLTCTLCDAQNHGAQDCPVLTRIENLNANTPGANPAVTRLGNQ
jgi:hypothetical protein